jgi:hypothetical protein
LVLAYNKLRGARVIGNGLNEEVAAIRSATGVSGALKVSEFEKKMPPWPSLIPSTCKDFADSDEAHFMPVAEPCQCFWSLIKRSSRPRVELPAFSILSLFEFQYPSMLSLCSPFA